MSVRKNLLIFSTGVLGVFLLAGCVQSNAVGQIDWTEEMTLSNPSPDGEVLSGLPNIASIAGLVGGTEKDAIEIMGKGEDYIANDGFTYIGRVYETQLCGEPVTVYTDCGKDNQIDALITWITDGSTEVSDTMIQQWKKRITDDSGAAMQEQPVSSASGMQCWNWRTEDTVYELRLLDHVLTLSVTAAVGELDQ